MTRSLKLPPRSWPTTCSIRILNAKRPACAGWLDGVRPTPHPCPLSQRTRQKLAIAPSGSSLVVEGCVDSGRVRWTARASMASELAVDARQVALSKEQCLFVLERSGALIGVASKDGFF